MVRERKRRSRARVVTYSFETSCPAAEPVLAKARELGTVTAYDVGSELVWFQGPPGPELRAIRDRIERLSR